MLVGRRAGVPPGSDRAHPVRGHRRLGPGRFGRTCRSVRLRPTGDRRVRRPGRPVGDRVALMQLVQTFGTRDIKPLPNVYKPVNLNVSIYQIPETRRLRRREAADRRSAYTRPMPTGSEGAVAAARHPAAARRRRPRRLLIQALANSAGALDRLRLPVLAVPRRAPRVRDRPGDQRRGVRRLPVRHHGASPRRSTGSTCAAPCRGCGRGASRPRPSARETLIQPLWQTASAFCGWIGAAVIFGLLNDDSARVSVGIVLAGLVTCSILYLLLERHFRPIFALALQDAELPENRREILPRLMLAWWLGSAIPLLAVAVAPMTAPDDSELVAQGWEVSLLVVTCLAAGGLIMRAAAGSVAGPINQVRRAMRSRRGGRPRGAPPRRQPGRDRPTRGRLQRHGARPARAGRAVAICSTSRSAPRSPADRSSRSRRSVGAGGW